MDKHRENNEGCQQMKNTNSSSIPEIVLKESKPLQRSKDTSNYNKKK